MSECSTESVKKHLDGISCLVGGDCHKAAWVGEMPLPIPFINGQPADIDEMTVDQLKTFLIFAYSSYYKKKIPDMDSTEEPPTWWTKAIVFDNTLKLTSGYWTMWHVKYLVELLCKFYDFCHCGSLLQLSSDLASIHTNGISNGVRFHLEDSGNVFKHGSSGKTLIAIDHSTRTYDLNTQDERNGLETEMASSRVTQVDQKTDNCPYETTEMAPSQHHTRNKNCTSVSASNGASKLDQDDFMNALGLSKVSKEKPGTSLSIDLPYPIPPPAIKNGKKPSRNPFLSIIKKNPFLPITSGPGLHLLSKLGGKIEQKDMVYPPPYESHCQAVQSERMRYRRRSKAGYRVNTDPSILKDGHNPHIYSYGRGKLQRTVRNQELVLGLNRTSWPALRKCKNVRLHLKKIHPATKRIQIRGDVSGTSFLMRAFRAATLQSRIKVVDCMKYPDSTTMPFVSKLLGESSHSSVLKRPRNEMII